jgi:hypothetical protein
MRSRKQLSIGLALTMSVRCYADNTNQLRGDRFPKPGVRGAELCMSCLQCVFIATNDDQPSTDDIDVATYASPMN